MGPGEYLLDKLESAGLSGEEAWERAFGVPPADKTPFAEPAEAPSEIDLGDPKHRRVSNALYKLATDAARVEADFEYQYGYNRELVAELAKEKKESGELRLALNRENVENAGLVAEILSFRLAAALRPRRALKWLAALGWALALLTGSVLAAEKISGSPIDKLASDCILELSDN
jgi:hypothetical protein